MTGTRPGGAIAAAWAVMTYLGEEGYLRVVGATMAYLRRWWDGIEAIDGLEVMGKPAMSVFGYTSKTLDMFAIADGLEARGWLVTLDTLPVSTRSGSCSRPATSRMSTPTWPTFARWPSSCAAAS